MEKIKTLLQIANRIHEALAMLKNERYMKLANRLSSFSGQLKELDAESGKMGASLAENSYMSVFKNASSE